MAIQIIGAPRAADETASPLPKVEVSFPQPGALPANAAVFSDDQVRAMLHHENSIVRGYAVEQAALREGEGEEWNRALIEKVNDSDDVVAADAIHALETRKYKAAAEAIAERFANGSTRIVISAARALGELSPERLLELVRARGRLEDEAYGATATAVACIGSNEVVDYLDKALNRSGALSPERRGALFGAALLSGSTALANRVIMLGLADSKKEEPEGASFPSRGALSAIAGMPLSMSRKQSGLELYDFARRVIESEILPLYTEEDRKNALEDALKKKNTAALLTSLGHVLELPEPPLAAGDRTVQSMPRRRRGLLAALLERKEEIGALDAAPAAVFVAAAAQSAAAIVAGGANDAFSPAIVAIVKALEANIDAHVLAAMNVEELTAFFKDKSERQMRRVHNILTHERTRQLGTLTRFANAIADAGHAQGLFEAAADIEDEGVHTAVIDAIARNREGAEAILVDALTRTPVEPKVALLALEAVDKVRTQRVATAIGRRFHELRELARPLLVRAVLRLGDERLIPLLESRAFPEEPEELAFALLSLANNAPKSERLDQAVARTLTPGAPENAEANVMLPLKCKNCKESLSYGFDRVLLDVESKDPYGDPAYVGDTTCKACGAIDQLEPTEQAGQIITSMMLDFLAAARRGPIRGTPLVAPAQTAYHGKRVGFAAALRSLDKEITESPESIRPRLHRARMRLILKRKGVEEDAAAVLAADARSPEGRALFASIAARDGDPAKSMEHALEALRLLRSDPPGRVYDADDPKALAASIEDLIVELERQGAPVPADADFTAARARRAAFDAERAAVPEDTQEDEENHTPAAPDSKVDNESLARAGRNDTCPCGSGKKFKKCHGKGK
jgi:hypothetical protein